MKSGTLTTVLRCVFSLMLVITLAFITSDAIAKEVTMKAIKSGNSECAAAIKEAEPYIKKAIARKPHIRKYNRDMVLGKAKEAKEKQSGKEEVRVDIPKGWGSARLGDTMDHLKNAKKAIKNARKVCGKYQKFLDGNHHIMVK